MRDKILTVMFMVISGALYAQSIPIDGQWEFNVVTQFRTDHIVIDFTAAGNVLGGTITRSDPPGQTPTNLKGEVNNDTLTFSVTSPDGLRTINMQGQVAGEEIHFTRTVTGTHGRGPGDSFYGLYGPDMITATRTREK